jgi:hypothetical protein
MSKKKVLLGVLLAAGFAAMLAGGVAAAMPEDCLHCEACGCANDGGVLMCCYFC